MFYWLIFFWTRLSPRNELKIRHWNTDYKVSLRHFTGYTIYPSVAAAAAADDDNNNIINDNIHARKTLRRMTFADETVVVGSIWSREYVTGPDAESFSRIPARTGPPQIRTVCAVFSPFPFVPSCCRRQVDAKKNITCRSIIIWLGQIMKKKKKPTACEYAFSDPESSAFPPFPRVSGNRPIAKSRDRSPRVYCSLNNNIMYSESIVFYNRVVLLSSFSLANSLYYIIYFPSYTKKKKKKYRIINHYIL